MSLNKPNEHDIRKLHNEINQIVNQRFVITTFALTLSGVMIAWMIPNNTPPVGTDLGAFTFVVSIILSALLFILYYWNHLLKRAMRIFTSYLTVTEASGWELDWKKYRNRHGYSAHTKPQAMIFLFLNAIGAGFPFLLGWIYSLKLAPVLGIFGVALVFTITELLISVMAFAALKDAEIKSANQWNDVNDNSN